MKFKMEEKKLKMVLEGAKVTERDEGVITLKKDRWMMKCVSTNTVILFGVMVPDSDMENYSRGEYNEIGIRINPVLDFINSTSDMVTVEVAETSGGVRKLHVSKEGSHLAVPLVNTEYVEGVGSKVPNLDWAVEFEGEISFIEDFVNKKANGIINGDTFMLSPREDGLYLYSSKDDSEIYDKLEWDKFDGHELNWGKGKQDKDIFKNPSEDHAMDNIFSVDWASNLDMLADSARVYIDNHCPIKIVFDTDGDMKASYFLSPRITGDDESCTLPERVLEE